MKLTYREGRRAAPPDERIVQAGLDDGLAPEAVRMAPTPDAAWDLLGVPAPFDPALRERLTAALERVLASSDAIVKGLRAFRALDPDADVPPAWVDRMVELHAAELEAYWALDEEAVAGAAAGGWTTGDAGALDCSPEERVAQRARWQAEAVRPGAAALWFDKLARRLDRRDEGVEAVRNAGRTLLVEATRHRFANWQQTRGTR